MHAGHGTYSTEGIFVKKVVDERDLGAIFENNLKGCKRCAKVVTTANRVMVKRSFSYLTHDILIQLYKSLVMPHLEYLDTSFEK